ncbi:MAG: prephenate dehydrogenase/arogenate dehydrogenase family protein [Candidatus Dadabacteria bacterium]|nr:MAG: prephenate dehydrogenase/arogenate dehydrogenase family protein [Candidatus Dadabacteria bacterium]
MAFNNVTILGVGLIGASLALALKEGKLCNSILGFGRNEDNLRRAQSRGIIDEYRMDAASAVELADLVVLATPVGTFRELIEAVRPGLRTGAAMLDVGSVKGTLVYDLETLMPEGVAYIGTHPIAGGDRSGIEDARADLFRYARCIVTPTENSDTDALRKVAMLWEAVGSRVEFMDPFKHDELYAAVSHLPHLLAYALVNTVGDFDDGAMQYAGQGFRDTTRIALSSPELWRDISILNRENILRVLGILRINLDRIEVLLKAGDQAGLDRELGKAQQLRMQLLGKPRQGSQEPGNSMSADQGL